MVFPDLLDQKNQLQQKNKKDTPSSPSLASFHLSIPSSRSSLLNSFTKKNLPLHQQAELITESINHNLGSFVPDILIESLVNNFSLTQKQLGPRLLKLLTGYSSHYLQKNIYLPEFQRQLKEVLQEKFSLLQQQDILESSGSFTPLAFDLSAFFLLEQELDSLFVRSDFGQQVHKKKSPYGLKADCRPFKRSDRYRDLALKSSLKLALRRGHSQLYPKDLKSFQRNSRGGLTVIYLLDASGSMKGEKIAAAKRAGLALAFQAINNRDLVGLVVFGSHLKSLVEPTLDFSQLLFNLARVHAAHQTNLAGSIEKSLQLFPDDNSAKHLILLTDALPTISHDKTSSPSQQTLKAVSQARDKGVTVSLVGISLNQQGQDLAQKIVELGQGKFYLTNYLQDIDKLVLSDYYQFF